MRNDIWSEELLEQADDEIDRLRSENEDLAERIDELMDEIDELKKHEWISVKGRLPEELTPVNVVWVNHNPQLYYRKIKDVPQSDATAIYFCGRWYWWDTDLIDWLSEYGRCSREDSLVDKDIEITHWMPLPEPPEVEE